MPHPRFDATVTLFSHHLVGSPLGALPRETVVEAVGRAVRALPGAAWVDVEHAGGWRLPESVRHRSPLDRLYTAGSCIEPNGPEWSELRERVEAAIARALAGEAPEASMQPTTIPAPPGPRRWFLGRRDS